MVFTTPPISNANSNALIVETSQSSLTIQVKIEQEKLHSFVSEQNEISYYHSLVLAVPFDGDISLAGLTLGTIESFHKTNQIPLALGDIKIIRFSEPTFVRGQKLVTVYIFPVTQNGIYNQIQFSVQFTGTTSNGKSARENSPFQKIITATVLNNKQSVQFASRPLQKLATGTTSSLFSQSLEWIKIEVNETGLYKLTGAQLDATGMTITGQSSSSIQLFNGGGKQLPVPNEINRPLFEQIAIKVIDGGDGVFDSNDYILFYGEAVNRWIYDTSKIKFETHSYTEKNVYWLTTEAFSSGLRMVSADGTSNGSAIIQTIDSHTRREHVEQNHKLLRWSDNKTNDYYTWYWSNSNDLSFFVSVNDLIVGDTVYVTLNGKTFPAIGDTENNFINLYVNGIKGLNKACNSSGCTYRSLSFVNGSNSINMSLTPIPSIPAYFNYLELNYNSYNDPINNQLDLPIGQISGYAEIEVSNSFTSNPLIFDISNPMHPRELVLSSYGVNSFSFYDNLSSTKFNRYFLMPESQSLSPFSMSLVTPNEMRATLNQTDLIIIAPRFLQSSLSEYISYRTNSGYAIQSVTVEDIMDNFSFGLYDPTAIRDFLKFSYENYQDPKPSAVLFVGDANYDFINNLSTNMPNYVPPFTHRTDNTASDDNYVYFGDFGILDSDTSYDASVFSFNKGYDMMTARWPIRTSSDVRTITDKIKLYESNNNFGNWRSNVTLVADDEFGTLTNEAFHTTQTEQLEKYHLPLPFNRSKIYLWEFPFVNGEKPEVNNQIVNAFNNGSLLVNYVGHGNPDVWAHENVFNRASDLPRLSNETTLPLVLAASCAIGFYDDPLREGMAEELLAMQGGAIGIISATRLVYSSDNAQFNRKIYDKLFDDNSLTMCEALYAAKLERQYLGSVPRPQINDRNYLYFGGPFVNLAKPQYKISFTSQPDSLIALGQTEVIGTVIDDNGSPIIENGIVEINVRDSKRDKTYQLKNPSGQVTNEVDYSVNGPTIFRGSATVTNGQFDFQFVAPLDIGFGGEGAQISVYVAFQEIDAFGIVDSISISDSIAVTNDSIGPVILAAFSDHQNFISGDFINKGESMLLQFSDESGINLAGGLGHGVTLEIDNQPEKLLNLTPYFSYTQDSYNNGTIEFPLEELAIGAHTFKIKAWDNVNNFTKLEFEAEIKSSANLQIVNLLNYPNPMQESTRFSFSLTQAVDNFVLDIFTLSGKKIKTFNRNSLEPTYYDDIVWYGKDVDGDRVATEVYIYKATAYPSDGSDKVETFGKIILVN